MSITIALYRILSLASYLHASSAHTCPGPIATWPLYFFNRSTFSRVSWNWNHTGGRLTSLTYSCAFEYFMSFYDLLVIFFKMAHNFPSSGWTIACMPTCPRKGISDHFSLLLWSPLMEKETSNKANCWYLSSVQISELWLLCFIVPSHSVNLELRERRDILNSLAQNLYVLQQLFNGAPLVFYSRTTGLNTFSVFLNFYLFKKKFLPEL